MQESTLIILTINLFLINEIQIFFLLCTILTESFNLILILLFYENCFNFKRGVLLLGFGNLAGWYSYFLGTIIRHTRVYMLTNFISLLPLFCFSRVNQEERTKSRILDLNIIDIYLYSTILVL